MVERDQNLGLLSNIALRTPWERYVLTHVQCPLQDYTDVLGYNETKHIIIATPIYRRRHVTQSCHGRQYQYRQSRGKQGLTESRFFIVTSFCLSADDYYIVQNVYICWSSDPYPLAPIVQQYIRIGHDEREQLKYNQHATVQ